MTPIPSELDNTQRAALALFHAARARADTSAAAIATASGLTIDEVLQALAPLGDQNIILAEPVRPYTSPPPSEEWPELRDILRFEMMPWLPVELEGLLDYSPADDEARVRRALGGRRPGGQDEAALGASLDLPTVRVSEALTRLEHRDIEREEAMGTRMRVVLEVTFPDYRVDPDEPPGSFKDMLDRWSRAIEANDAVACRDVQLKELSAIPFDRVAE